MNCECGLEHIGRFGEYETHAKLMAERSRLPGFQPPLHIVVGQIAFGIGVVLGVMSRVVWNIVDVLLFTCVFVALVLMWGGILLPLVQDLAIVLAFAVPVFAGILALVRMEVKEARDYPVLHRWRSGRNYRRRR